MEVTAKKKKRKKMGENHKKAEQNGKSSPLQPRLNLTVEIETYVNAEPTKDLFIT